MDDKKICFITCVNHDKYEQEMRKYINHPYKHKFVKVHQHIGL